MAQGEQKKNMRLISHSQLNGFGNCGEGFALKQLPDGRRVLFIAHESAPIDFSVVDVTNPSEPQVILQTELPHSRIRSNSLAAVGDILLVAYQAAGREGADKFGVTPAGVTVYDIGDVENPKRIAFFDTSGSHSRGCHCLWFVDGRYAHLCTGMPDATPRNPLDDQFYVIVDLADPTKPREVGRWWLPGTHEGDDAPPPIRHTQLDMGFRTHNINVYPQRPDRAYVAYIDGGVIILDISDMSRPKMISRVDYHPPFAGFTHTVLPLFDRDLLVVTDEEAGGLRSEASTNKFIWVMDVREESNPVIISTFPKPSREEYPDPKDWMGPHNVHENEPLPTSWYSSNLIVGTFFAAGVRAYDISNPYRPEEVAFYVPPVPEGAPYMWINDVYIDERGLVYAIDRVQGGLYILEMEL